MKKIKSKLFAVITVMALFFTNFVPALSNFTELTAYAAAATNVTVTSMAETGGHLSSSSPFGVAHDIQYIYISSQSTPATCLEFNTTCMTGNNYTKHTNQAYWENMSDSQKKAIRLIMHYGYYNDKADHHTQAYFDATQLLVWEVTGYQWHNNHAPLRTFVMDENASNAGSSSCSTPLINYYSGSSDTRAKYNEILANIDTHFDRVAGSYINWYSKAEPQRLAKANPLQLKWNSSNFRYELTMRRVKSVWDRYRWTDVLRAAGFTVESKQYSGDMYDYTIWTREPIKKSNAIVVDTKSNTSTNSTFAVYHNTSVSGDNAQGWGGGQTIGIGGNSYLFAAMAFYNEPDKPPEPTPITVQKYAEDERIANVPNYSSIKGSLVFALQAKTGNTWSYVYFTSSGNKYTYSSVASGGDPWQLKLDDKGEFILANLPYGTYRLYESWRGSPTGLKSAGLQNPPSSYVKEFTVSASSSTTQKVVNKKMLNGSLEIDKHVDMVDKNTPIPESAYTSLTFTIKDKSGQYLVLDTVDAAAGTYKYNTTTATAANATKIKLGTSTHKAVVTDMPIDTDYVVEETCGDPRFKAYSDTVTVNIVAETSSDAPFSNYEVYGSIKGVKVDKNDPSKKLVGAVYGLFKEGTTTFNTSTAYKTATSGSDGVFTFDKVPYGNYIIRELTAPQGYKLSTEQKNVTISSQGQTVTVEVADPPINIWFSKKSVTGNAELAGAKMQLRTSTGSVIDSWTSGSSAHLVECVAAGSYVLHEEAAPNGYVLAQDISFSVDINGKVTDVSTTSTVDGEPIITMTDDVTKVTVSKKTITGSDELVGAKMQLLDSNGTLVDEWISTSEPHYIEGKLIAGATYTLHEEYAPNGYVIANDVTFVVSEDGSVDTVKMVDDTTKVQISKQDITNGEELAGAKLQVKDSSGNVVDEWTSTDTPHYIEGKFIAGATYTLHEEAAPNGYVVANDITFVVSEDGRIDTVTMIDDTTKVQISKQDITNGKELAGAKLQVKDSDGNVVDEWTSTDKPHYIEGKLTAGQTYTLHEEYAPNGYVVANDITFVVSEDGSVDTVKMVDDTTKVQISKQDITNGKELAGAKLQVKDSDGNVVDEWTSTDKPHMIEGKLVANKIYTLHEEIAPDGYVVANDIEFTVSSDGSVDTVVMIDDIAKGTVAVQKTTEGMLNIEGIDLVLSGVSFLGLDVNITATTDKNGIAVFENVPVGTYTITEEESTVPYGYLTADPVEGVEVIYAQQTDVEIYNAEMTGSIAVSKTTEGMVNLEGIEFILSGITDTGREIALKATTNATGLAVFENVPVGTYAITENDETVPYGYLVADPIEGVEVIYAQQTDVEIFNAEMTGSIAVNKTTEGMVNLEGIEFVLSGVTDTGREIELQVLTDEAGTAIFENVPIGTYTITENGETVPYGYLTADPIEGVEVVYAQQTDVVIYNAEMTGSIRVQKKTEGMKDLEGIGFKLSGTTATGRDIILYVKTDKDGLAVFEGVPVGTYTLTEDGQTVPKGYLIARAVEGVEVVYSEQTSITVVNDKVPENPKTGDTAPYAAVAVCTLIAVAALLLRKRTDNFVD